MTLNFGKVMLFLVLISVPLTGFAGFADAMKKRLANLFD